MLYIPFFITMQNSYYYLQHSLDRIFSRVRCRKEFRLWSHTDLVKSDSNITIWQIVMTVSFHFFHPYNENINICFSELLGRLQ